MKVIYFMEGKNMLSKGKKIFILVAMVALLVVTGYLNVALNGSDSDLQTTTSSSANFFTTCRADKLATRNYQIEVYDEIIKTSTDAEEVKEYKQKKNEVIANMETEKILETKIMAAGYEDAIVTNANGIMNVFVKSISGLNLDEAAKILSIITSQIKIDAANVKITEIA